MSLLRVEGLRKAFGGLIAVNDLRLEVERGEVLGLIGPNGAGKTTVFNLISCVYPPDSGTIEFDRKNIVGLKPYDVCRLGIARTFQVTKPFGELTTLENVMVGAFLNHGSFRSAREKALYVLDFVGLLHKKDVIGYNLTVGERKKLELARALATEPKLLLLDEVMAGFHPREKQDIVDLIIRTNRDAGVTMIIVEHDMRAIMSLCNRVVLLIRGEKLVEGTPSEVSQDERAIKAYLGEGYRVA